MYSEATRILSTLKIVEYRSPPPLDTAMAFKESTIHLFVYELFDDARNFSKHESQEIPMTEITHLPHESLKNKWEEYVEQAENPCQATKANVTAQVDLRRRHQEWSYPNHEQSS